MALAVKEKIILALDVPNRRQAGEILCKFHGQISWVKIGLQLFCAEGPKVVRDARESGFRVFLDLKLHDIPNTVTNAIQAISNLGVEMLTVHCLGGPSMLDAAVSAAKEANIALLGVTCLTSMDENETRAIGYTASPTNVCLNLAKLANMFGLSGIVASPLEIRPIRHLFGDNFLIVTPGIRPKGSSLADQKRTLDPASAFQAGSDYLVIGRPLYTAPDPVAALNAIVKDIEQSTKPQTY
ncbi:MAG: orotidine-5'-phosphate decarboxylase [Chthoniobacterales bacterium]|nr:orotidine-5'-phosphate decarboxylase [Chthoniobacterales bacterium]MCX7712047.1 orotidine-5'-phosphate decarboxylase [Chthoniobacterales bacterium]